jgi:peroxiredoxin (alkyl hydroperoxide reductase subunit C)
VETATSPALPRLDEPAPDFKAVSTQGEITLSQFRGKWVVLFSHPADFTPVCTTEFVEIARRFDEFEKLNVQLIGLAIDSIHAHVAWIRNIEELFDVRICFPVIADLDMKVAQSYGMIPPGAASTATVRCVVVIDDRGVLRAMVSFPLTNGRNIDEVLCIVKALQAHEQHKVVTPANRQAGEKAIVPPPPTQEAAEIRVKEPHEARDRCFAGKELAV